MNEKCTECGGSTEDPKAVNVLGKPIGCRACGATGTRAEQERRIRAVFDCANDGKTCGELARELEALTLQP